MVNKLWCEKHQKLVLDGRSKKKLAIVAVRLMAAFSQHPDVLRALYHDPFVSELDQQARFMGVSALCVCICCFLGDETVEKIVSQPFDPYSAPAKDIVVV